MIMMNPDRFQEIADEEAERIPQEFYEGLNLGIIIEEGAKHHSVSPQLITMGEYRRGPEGNQIILYYGSFCQLCGVAAEEFWRTKIREVIRHEFRHHMEGRAGIRDLEYEDKRDLEEFLAHQNKQDL
jgi:predicted Zn-dependent protease with MMP-like domain